MKIRTLIALSASAATLGFAAEASAQRARAISQSAASQAAKQHPQIVEQFGGAETGSRGAYVTSVGRKIAAQSGVPGGGSGVFTITTLNSPVMNAFAVPGGYVYITRQLMGLMDDEAEMASVLGHEVGHIAARHSESRQTRGLLSQIGAVLVGVVTGSGQLAQLAGQVSQGLFLQFSRGQEFQADDLGIRYMTAAGYDPDGPPVCSSRWARRRASKHGQPGKTTSAPRLPGQGPTRSARIVFEGRLSKPGRPALPDEVFATATSSWRSLTASWSMTIRSRA
jgi:predicted Zn-dependent protease